MAQKRCTNFFPCTCSKPKIKSTISNPYKKCQFCSCYSKSENEPSTLFMNKTFMYKWGSKYVSLLK